MIPEDADSNQLCQLLDYSMSGLEAPVCTIPSSSAKTPQICQSQAVDGRPVHSCIPLCESFTGGRASQPTCSCSRSRQFTVMKFIASDYEDFWVDLKYNVVSHGGRRLQDAMIPRDSTELLNKMNFARNFAHDYLLPLGVQKSIYIDTDTVVQKDIVDLWNTKLTVFHLSDCDFIHVC